MKVQATKPNYVVRRLQGNWRVIHADGSTTPISKKGNRLWYVSGTYRQTLRDAIIYAAYNI